MIKEAEENFLDSVLNKSDKQVEYPDYAVNQIKLWIEITARIQNGDYCAELFNDYLIVKR